MSTLPISAIVTWLVLLVNWSIRWGLVLAALALWFALEASPAGRDPACPLRRGAGGGPDAPVRAAVGRCHVRLADRHGQAWAESEPARAARAGDPDNTYCGSGDSTATW